jgi:hypothetical protein
MWIGVLVVLWRMDPAYGTLALVAVLSRIVQSQFDLFWIAVSVSVPFVIAGICVGAMALDHSSEGASARRATQASRRLREHT